MAKILYHRIFRPNPLGHGGEKRAAQLQELYDSAGVEVSEFLLGKDKLTLLAVLKSVVVIFKSQGFILPALKKYLLYVRSVAWNIISFEHYLASPLSLFVWESTRDFFYFLPYMAKNKRKRIIAFPHNIESLVPGVVSLVTNKKSPTGFYKEVEVLKSCDAVFTISREEQWLLSLFGVKSYYLPYYPPLQVFNNLLLVRQRRESRQRTNKVLMLGSALNAPTMKGMLQMVEFWKTMPDTIELRVAGYGTSKLLSSHSNNVEIVGELDQEQLDNEMVSADCLIVHQPPTTGALTRIVEFLIAGIPVLTNPASARSYWGYDGLYVYDSIENLKGLINNDFDMPHIPAKPDYSVLLNKIISLS